MDDKAEIYNYESRMEVITGRMLSRNREAEYRISADQQEVLKILRLGVKAIQTLSNNLRTLGPPPQTETESTVLSSPLCANCREPLSGLFTECFTCETNNLYSTTPGGTFTCIRCQDHLTCMLEWHCQALRHTEKSQWRLKFPVIGSKRLEKLWVRCTLCGTVLPDLDTGFTWCIPCSKTGVGTFCDDCTAKGSNCGQYGHPSPRTTLERVNTDPMPHRKDVSLRDIELNRNTQNQTLQINRHFRQLSKAADKQLDTIMEVNLEVTELEDKLDSLRLDIDGSVSRISVVIENTQTNLIEKNSELEIAQKEKNDLEYQTARVNAKLEGNKEDRNVLRVVCAIMLSVKIIVVDSNSSESWAGEQQLLFHLSCP